MRLRQIEVFHAVYQCGSISTAARTLNVSQPSVSKVLMHAERELGFRLFKRVKSRLVPTDEAHALFREVREVFERLDALRSTARSLRVCESGHLRIAALPALGLGVVPEAVARLRTSHPGATFDIHTLHHDEMVRALHERQCDLALVYDPPEHPRIVKMEIGRGELMVLFRRGEFGASPPERIDLAALCGRNYIGSGSTGPVSDVFAAEAQRRGLVVDEVVTVGTFYMAVPLVRFGAGVAVVDQFTAQAGWGKDLEMRPLQPALTFGVHGMHLEDHPPSRLARALLDATQAALLRGPPRSSIA